jgi:hypothetical protein
MSPVQYSRRDREYDQEIPIFPCPMCGEDVNPDMLLTCTVCGGVGCEADIDVSVLVCEQCLGEEEEEDELEEAEARERGR